MANIFRKSTNMVPIKVIIAIILVKIAVISLVTYYFTPLYTRVGYEPIQPVAFDHALHSGQLGIDCRYCHTFVDRSEHSNVPDTSTCMNCHEQHIKPNSPLLEPIRQSYASGDPVPWVRIHKTPDYVFFNHSVHVNRGISCVECHGQINEMEVVHHAKRFSMSFCLDCHRNPEEHVRPIDEVYNLDWKAESPEAQKAMGEQFVHDWKIMPPESCSGCHR